MDTIEKYTREIGGLVATVEIVPDYDPDLSWLGEWTDLTADEHGCGKRHVRNGSYDSSCYRYFCPSFGCDPRPWREIAADNGWTKEQMFEAAQTDERTAREWYGCGVVVTIEAGDFEGSASLWGMDWMTDEDHIENDVVPELIAEAQAEVISKLTRKLMGGKASGSTEWALQQEVA